MRNKFIEKIFDKEMIKKKKCQIKLNHPSGKHHRRYISLINMIKEFQFQKVGAKT